MTSTDDLFPNRIVCLTDEPTEILYLLGEESRIVGISGFTVRPAKARKEKPKVSAFNTANIEEIISLQPDLVIGFSDVQAEIARELIAKGITVLINNHRTVSEIYKMIVQIGSMVGKQKEASSLVKQLQESIQLRCSANQNERIKPKIYFEEWDEPLITGIHWVSEIIEMAGGIDIFDELKSASLAKDRIIEDPSVVIKRNPDIILASWCGKKFRKDRLVSREHWNSINAVMNEQIFEIKSEIILQPGPAALTEGIDQIASIIENWHLNQSNS